MVMYLYTTGNKQGTNMHTYVYLHWYTRIIYRYADKKQVEQNRATPFMYEIQLEVSGSKLIDKRIFGEPRRRTPSQN
jgi:hypothetical protein